MKNLIVKEGNTKIEVKDFSLVDRWIQFLQVKPSTEKSYRKGVKNFANFLRGIGIINPCSVARENVLEYRAYLEKKYKSPYTMNLYLTGAKLFLDFLTTEGFINGVNPAFHIKNFKTSKGHKKDAITPAENKKILQSFDTSTLKGKRDYAIYALAAVCGLRTVEICRARIENLVEGEDGKVFLFVQGKGHDTNDESVHVPTPVMNIIQNYLDARGDVPTDAPLFASLSHRNFGKSISTTTISTTIKNILRRNGINTPRKTAHSLRHGAATAALKNGASLREVQQFLRHSSINITTRYLHDLDRENNPSESLVAGAYGLA